MGGSWGKERETVIYRQKQLLLEAHTQISTLEDEALELVRYIKRKGKAVEVWDKEAAVSGRKQ